jgi:uncharacterized damage-inducible protein DinB
MKKLLPFLAVILLVSFSSNKTGLTKKEKKYAVDYLELTKADLQNTVAGLSEDQFNFNPAADRWSIKECLQHIVLTETALWQMTDGTLKAAANPDKRSEIKATDEDLVKRMTDRTNKVKTVEALYPEKATTVPTALSALNAFNEQRGKLIKFMKKTDDDMRNHVVQTPLGWLDSYQMVLFMAAHSNRHTQQIAEVKADPNFPKQ